MTNAATLDPGTVEQIVTRAGRPDFDRWTEQVERCGHCSRPVRLRGRVVHSGPDGRREAYSTDAEPDRVLLVRCRNRRASVCPSCSYEYAGDMWQLLYAGAAGGRKGVPDTVRAHPLVFATLTAPGFGPVHGTRTGKGGGAGLCQHGRPTWCTAVHTEDDPRLGEPLCGDCYDYPAHVAFNWHAPELWRRFTITLRRVLARRTGLRAGEFNERCRLSFVKVAEYQRRAVVHFHALIRLDGPGSAYAPPLVRVDAGELAAAIEEAASAVRLTVDVPAVGSASGPEVPPGLGGGVEPTQARKRVEQSSRDPVAVPGPHLRGSAGRHGERHQKTHGQLEPGTPRRKPVHGSPPVTDGHGPVISHRVALVLRFGNQTDTQPVNGGPAGELTPERVAAYIAKYATKSAEDFGLGGQRITLATLPYLDLSEHVETVVRTCWELGDRPEYAGVRRWLHMAGFRGRFASKSRRYSTTLGAIRRERHTWRRRQTAEHARQLGDQADEETTLVVGQWEFAGLGYLSTGDAALAMSAAARARERRKAARDAFHAAG